MLLFIHLYISKWEIKAGSRAAPLTQKVLFVWDWMSKCVIKKE